MEPDFLSDGEGSRARSGSRSPAGQAAAARLRYTPREGRRSVSVTAETDTSLLFSGPPSNPAKSFFFIKQREKRRKITKSPHRSGFHTPAHPLPNLPSKGKFAENTEARFVRAGQASRDPPGTPAAPPSPQHAPERGRSGGRPAMCMHTHFHQLLRVFCESQRGASQLALPDSTAFPSLAQNLPPHAAAREGFSAYIYYICGIILRTSSGQARKDCTGAFFFPKGRGKKAQPEPCASTPCVPGRGKKEECLRSGLSASARAGHFGRGPGTRSRGARAGATRAPSPFPGQASPRIFREGEIDRTACLQRKRTSSTHSPSPRHHNLNPSPTLRELQVTDHVGLTPERAGAPAPLPPPARVLQDRAPSSAKPPGVGTRAGGKGEN